MLAEQPEYEAVDESQMAGDGVIVTGGATGLGRAIALEFARRHVNVAVNYLQLPGRDIAAQALLTETELRSFGVRVFCCECDVRDPDDVRRFVNSAKAELGGLHFLINNAGIARDGALWRLPTESWDDVLRTNVTGAFHCIQAVAPDFRSQHFGKIVNISSHQANHPGFGVSNYAASKAALIGLTKSAAVELGPSNINVNAVAPGFVRTDLLDSLPDEVVDKAEKSSVLGRLAEPRDVSHVVVFLCSEDARHITGQVIVVDGGMTLT